MKQNDSIIPAKSFEEVLQRKQILERFRQSPLSMTQFCKENGIGVSWLSRLNKRAGASEKIDPALLVDSRTRNGRKPVIDQRALGWALCAIEKHPCSPLTVIHRALKHEAKFRSWVAPSYRVLNSHVNKLPQDLRILMKDGATALFEQISLVARREFSFPNEQWSMDFTEAPIWVRDIEDGTKLYKPYLTLIIDSFSRAMVGFKLHKATPDSKESLLALLSAIDPGQDVRNPYNGLRLPQKLRADHGSVYRGCDFQDALLRCSIIDDPATKTAPSSNGKVERAIQTVIDLAISYLDGFANRIGALKRAEHNALPLNVIERKLTEFMHVYNHTLHSSIGKTPYEAYTENLDKAYGLDVSKEILDNAMRFRHEASVERDGISIYGSHWMCPELLTHVGDRIIIRLPVDQRIPSEIDCFAKNGDFIGMLSPVDRDSTLAQAINEARLKRTLELMDLKRAIKETGAIILRDENGVEIPSENNPSFARRDTPDSSDFDPIIVPDLKIEEQE